MVSSGILSIAVKDGAKQDGIKLRVCWGKPQKALSALHCQQRLKFGKANQGRVWDTILFTDRKKFHLTYPGSSVRSVRWREGDEEDSVPRPNHPTCVNVYGGIPRWATTDLIMVTGTSKYASG